MFIRYTTIRNILLVVAVLAVVGVLLMWAMSDGEDDDGVKPVPKEVASESSRPETTRRGETAPTPPPETTASTPTPTPSPGADVPYADVAEMILNERATEKKIKDLNSGRGAKINLYDDDQDGQWDRAKIDADRDDEDDEKWTFKNGHVERRILTDDTRFIYTPGEGWSPK